MISGLPHVCVSICTFQRPELLRRLLERLLELEGVGKVFTLSCSIVDNDQSRSAEPVVRPFRDRLELVYDCEIERNFAVVRNRVVRNSRGDYIAFIDDDEVPVKEWLVKLLATAATEKFDGALGPVRPYYDDPPPRWLERSGLCDRPVHPTGMILTWRQTRTGNTLLRRNIFDPGGLWFDPAFRTGGEDVDFFKRAIAAGHRFVWCEEAPAYELVPPDRMRLAYYLRRALLQGGISLKYGLGKGRFVDKVRVALTSAAALLIYLVALPFLFLGGAHRGVVCMVKMCHHFGRLTTLCGIPILRERKL